MDKPFNLLEMEKETAFLALTFIILMIGGAYASDITSSETDDLVAEYQFDTGAADTAYDTAGNNDGTINGATWIKGVEGNALSFDGNDDYVDSSDVNVFSSDEYWTVSLWFKSDDISKHIHFTGVPGEHSSGWTPLSHFGLRNSRLVWWDGAGWREGGTTLESNKWYHATIVGRGGEVEMYLNGREDHTETSNIENNIGRFTNIGRRQHSNDRYFDGKIDEFQAYDKALSHSRIKSNYNSGSWRIGTITDKNEPSKVAEFSFQHQNDSHVLDTSGYNNHGQKMNDVSQENAIKCKVGRCYNFDGNDDFVNVGEPGELSASNLGNSITMLAWVNPDECTDNRHNVVGKSSNSNNDNYRIWLNNDCSVSVYLDGAGGTITTETLDTNSWTMIAATYNGSKRKIYYDGILKDSRDASGSLDSGSGSPIAIGSRGGDSDFFDGKIDQVKIYNRSLSRQEIVSETENLKGEGAVLDLRFNREGGDKVHDHSEIDNHGSLKPNETYGPSKITGLKGRALNFKENNYVDISSGNSAYDTNATTVSVWVKPDSGGWIAGNGARHRIHLDTNDASWWIRSRTDEWRSNTINGGNTKRGEWYHVVGTFDSSANGLQELYLNGEKIASEETGGILREGSDNQIVGGSYGNNADFDGVIDNLKIFPFAASESKVHQLYSKGKTHIGSSSSSDSSGSDLQDGLVLSQTFNRVETCGQSDTISCPSGMSGEVAVDQSGEANHGEVNGPTEKNAGGCKVGGCLGFDGSDDFVEVPDGNLDLNLNKKITVSAWIKQEEAKDQKVVSKGNDWSSSEAGWILDNRNGNLRFNVLNSSGGDFSVSSSNVVSNGEWIHATGVYNGVAGEIKLYKNGELLKSSSVQGGSIHQNTLPLQMGSSSWGSNHFYNGSIDQIRVYNRSISKEEVWKLYSQGRDRSSGDMAGPAAHYPMQTEASPLRDVSGEGNHGDLNLLGESGTFNTSDGEWKTIRFKRSYKDPVVIGTTNTKQGENGIYFETREVRSNQAEMRLCESEGADNDGCDSHGTERAGYVVIDAASTDDIPGIEAGSFRIDSDIDSKRESVSYSESFSSTPMVFTQVMTDNGRGEVESWLTSKDTNGFSTGICQQDSTDACNGAHPEEEVGWVAVEPGNEPFEQPGEANNLSNEIGSSNWGSKTFDSSFSETPVGVFELQTYHGGQDPLIDEIRNVDTSDMEMRFCELQTGDNCDGHMDNEYAYLAVSEGVLTYSNGNFPRYRDTKRGKALEFDGSDDYIPVSDNPELRADGFSVSTWFQSSSTSGWEVMASKEYWNNGEGWVLIQGSSGDSYVQLKSPSLQDLSSNKQYNDGQWHHATVTYNGSKVRLYVDGKLHDSASDSTFTPSQVDMYIGARHENDGSTGPKDPYNGKLDDVRIYPYALNQEQVNRVMNSGAANIG